ncbi:nucleotide exchange factor GrpE [Nocardia sp. NPDC051929]|uniref:nucleotide exchange factor GrpE n=1 Tax=Nocardia sp. NPDC051929 TaxID=3364327 RepID=UPI0037C7FBC3
MTEDNFEKEPITFVDNRKIDPETGDVRQQAADNGAAAAQAPQVDESVDIDNDDALADTISGELAERTADLQRLTAEYANYRRRVERDRKAVIDNAKASVVTELLGVLDDLDRARAHGDLESGPLRSVADKLSAALLKQGLEEFGSEGEPFDPTLHEAVQHEGSGHDPVIGIVMRKGYRFGDRVLRHALVGVTDGVADLTENAVQPTEEASDVDAGANDQ